MAQNNVIGYLLNILKFTQKKYGTCVLKVADKNT